MRKWLLSATLLLAACIPSGDRKPARTPQPRQVAARDTLQCLADLRREGVRYKALEDRTRRADQAEEDRKKRLAAQARADRRVIEEALAAVKRQ